MFAKEKARQNVSLGKLSLGYDGAGRLHSIKNAKGGCTFRVYNDEDNSLVALVSEKGRMTETLFDSDGNAVETVSYHNFLSPKQLRLLKLGYNANISVLRPIPHSDDQRVASR